MHAWDAQDHIFYEKTIENASKISHVIDKQLEYTFVQPIRSAIWEYYALNAEHVTSIADLIELKNKGSLRKEIPAKQPATKSGKQVVKKPQPAKEPPPVDELKELNNALMQFDLSTETFDAFDEDAYVKEKRSSYVEVLELELASIKTPVEPVIAGKPKSTQGKGGKPPTPPAVIPPTPLDDLKLISCFIRRPRTQKFMSLESWFSDSNDLKNELMSLTPMSRSGIMHMLIEESVIPALLRLPSSSCVKSILLYGPHACGKSTIINILASECDALIIDLDPSLVVEHNKNIVDLIIGRIIRVANHYHPVFVVARDLDILFPVPKPSKGSKTKSSLAYTKEFFVRDVLTGLLSKLTDTNAIVFATVSNGIMDISGVEGLFEKKIFVKYPSTGERRNIILHCLAKRGIVSADLGNNFFDRLDLMITKTAGVNIQSVSKSILDGLKRIDIGGLRMVGRKLSVSDLAQLTYHNVDCDIYTWDTWLTDVVAESNAKGPQNLGLTSNKEKISK
jgi:hypothetical protein